MSEFEKLDLPAGVAVRLTLENQYGVYSVASRDSVEHINDFVDTLIVPLLLSAGYHKDTIDEALGFDVGQNL